MRITYRATFRQPIGKLNPMGLKIPVPLTVELFTVPGNMWSAREIDSRDRRIIPPLQRFPSSQTAMKGTKAMFEEQVRPWTMHDPAAAGAPLEPSEVLFLDGGTAVRRPPTHNAGPWPAGAFYHRSYCGKRIAKREDITEGRPTCPQCRIMYDKEHSQEATQ